MLLNDRNLFTYVDLYKNNTVKSYPIMTDPDYWDSDLEKFMSDPDGDSVYRNQFFHEVASPAYCSWQAYKNGKYEDALLFAASVAATDWSRMMVVWLNKRINAKKEVTKNDD